MHHFFRLLLAALISMLLISCATTEKTGSGDLIIDESGSYKYAAWRPDNSGQYEAINVLITEADALIEKQALNEASDKLERVLRIKPEYAPAWSRLSWLALQANSPERAVQMAKRSNSFAQSDPELQLLNWTFIRAASQVLNDEDTYFRANQQIESLKAF
jgi:tetratricopeptide (TPR) repeat protein